MGTFTNFPNGLTSLGIPLVGDLNPVYGGIPGNVYVVSNPNDPNLTYVQARFGNTYYTTPSGVVTQMLQTNLQNAINACAHDRGDVVIVTPHTYVVTTPVLFNKKGVTVLASYNITGQDNGERFMINADATPGIPAAIISEPTTLIGLGFDSANTASGVLLGGTIQMGPGSGFDGGSYSRIRDCRFENFGHAVYGIDSQYNDYVKIEHCDFDGTINGAGGSANAFTGGVVVTQGHYVTIEENTFRGCGYAIVHGTPNPATAAHSNQNFIYKGNRVVVAGGTEKFVNFNTLATYSLSYGLVADNWLGTATDAASYNDTVANAKTAKVTFSGNHYAE